MHTHTHAYITHTHLTHSAVKADAFAFLEDAAKSKERWDLVIVDPPSFAPNNASVEKAKASYKNLFVNAAKVRGLLTHTLLCLLLSCNVHKGLSASRHVNV